MWAHAAPAPAPRLSAPKVAPPVNYGQRLPIEMHHAVPATPSLAAPASKVCDKVYKAVLSSLSSRTARPAGPAPAAPTMKGPLTLEDQPQRVGSRKRTAPRHHDESPGGGTGTGVVKARIPAPPEGDY